MDVRIFRIRPSSIISLREQSSAQTACAAFIGPLQHSITPAAVRLSAENLGEIRHSANNSFPDKFFAKIQS